jgi:restriction system protein
MKFQMSENSLFAVLLRSRWWVSFGICALIVVLARTFFSKELWVFVAAGGFPFFVLGCIAFWRQRGQLSPTRIEQWLSEAGGLSWPRFAQTLKETMLAKGYSIDTYAQAGADFEAQFQGRTVLVSAKRWKAAMTGLEPLQELQRAIEMRDSGRGMLISLSAPSAKAQEFARKHNIQLMFGKDLAQWMSSKSTGTR